MTRHSPIRYLLSAALLISASFAAPSAFAALTFTVNTFADTPDDNINDDECHTAENKCSLRAAVMQANHMSISVNIQIQLSAGTFVLAAPTGSDGEDSGDLNIESAPGKFLTIQGVGPAATIIDANHTSRAISIASGSTVFLFGLAIRNGHYSGINSAGDPGGGIFNDGTLTLSECTIENNVGLFGGGIYSNGALTIFTSTIRSNNGNNTGGGIAAYGPTTLNYSLVYANTALEGGGITYLKAPSGESYLYVIGSTISANMTPQNGGGIYAASGTVFLYNTSVIGNRANLNLSAYQGGGVFAKTGTRFGLVNSILARNIAGFDTNNDCAGNFEAYGRNLVGDPSSPNCATSNAPLGPITLSTIGPLKDNGGPTWTHALLAGSEAIDASLLSLGCVDPSGQPLTVDQRYAPRVAGTRCDLGAFEFGSIVPIRDFIFSDGFQ